MTQAARVRIDQLWRTVGAPVPAGYRLIGTEVGARLGDRLRDRGTPFEVLDERAAELRRVRQAHLVGGRDEHLDEASTLGLGDREVAVVAEQGAVATEGLGVRGRAAEDLAEPGGQVLDVPGPGPAYRRPR
jgi:hypothetical protein